MKEFTVMLEDKIADTLAQEADKKGLTIYEFIRYVLGSLVQEITSINTFPSGGIHFPAMPPPEIIDSLKELIKGLAGAMDDPSVAEEILKPMLRREARAGTLSCTNCTMKITPEDLDKGICGSCGASLVGMFKGPQ